MLTIQNIIVLIIGVILLIIWLAFYAMGYKNAGMFDSISEKDFPFKEIYFVGYAMMEKLNYQYKSKADRKLRKEIEIIYGSKYADFYLRIIYAQKVTISSLVLVAGFALYGLANDITILFIMFMFSGLAFYYYGATTEKMILKRSDEMLSDFSEVVSKLALLTNAGMILRDAWETIAQNDETTIYKEMRLSVEEMNNGVSEVDALFSFGSRCMIPEIKKFTSTIIQGIVKGNCELVTMLQEQSKEVWAAKKQNVRRQGEKASGKLLIPMAIMFIGILVMILIPVFANIGI